MAQGRAPAAGAAACPQDAAHAADALPAAHSASLPSPRRRGLLSPVPTGRASGDLSGPLERPSSASAPLPAPPKALDKGMGPASGRQQQLMLLQARRAVFSSLAQQQASESSKAGKGSKGRLQAAISREPAYMEG
jgi:hypothetical protein